MQGLIEWNILCVFVIVDRWFKSRQLSINTDFRSNWWLQGSGVTQSHQCRPDNTQRISQLTEPEKGIIWLKLNPTVCKCRHWNRLPVVQFLKELVNSADSKFDSAEFQWHRSQPMQCTVAHRHLYSCMHSIGLLMQSSVIVIDPSVTIFGCFSPFLRQKQMFGRFRRLN